jgi:hypothetical protein
VQGNRTPRKIFISKETKITGGLRKVCKGEIRHVRFSLNIITSETKGGKRSVNFCLENLLDWYCLEEAGIHQKAIQE